ncbi:hypothetical protein F4813DRAFT_371497 [Daldinia decipiens]|uniref:uncharacterized protein n=1 Tax=Daldinia decipiens TaxID=326647 RepID=UPI0020C30128|nr:uncharacterized protein F4813DRAFT_371497 [Daldinia decipiens]KAI1654355.1 hypothetical protein F4813DRAFT_371497 [Daldinia decipiens]
MSPKGTRLTHKSLPRLIIPLGSRRMEPEEITVSRVKDFLDYCIKNKKAPITRLPDIAFIPPPGTPGSGSGSTGDQKKGKEPEKKPSSHEEQENPDTIAFTDCEYDRLEALQAQLAEVKVLHHNLYHQTTVDRNNREAMTKCKKARAEREQINNEISEIYRKRAIRRDFRRDANNPKGIKNW